MCPGDPVDRYMLRNIQLQPLNVLSERRHAGGHGRRLRARGRGRVEIRVDENLFRRQVHHQHVRVMSQALHGMNLHGSNAIAHNVFLIHGLDRRDSISREPRILGRQPVGLQRPLCRVEQHVLIKASIGLVCNDGCALGDVGAKSAGMIEVVVRVHQVLNRLVGDELLDLGNDGKGSLFVLRPYTMNELKELFMSRCGDTK